LVEEDRGGVVTCYVSDTLGSVVKTTDASGNITSSTTYWPFGEVRTSSGTNPSPWGFVGTLGYYKDALARLYVRMRSLRTDLSRWLTVDLLWPWQASYGYVGNMPTWNIDIAGLFGFGNYCGPSRMGPEPPINAVDACCQTHDSCLATWCDWLNPINKVQCDCALCLCAARNLISSCKWNPICYCGAIEVMKWACQECARLGNPIPLPTPPNPGWICFILG